MTITTVKSSSTYKFGSGVGHCQGSPSPDSNPLHNFKDRLLNSYMKARLFINSEKLKTKMGLLIK